MLDLCTLRDASNRSQIITRGELGGVPSSLLFNALFHYSVNEAVLLEVGGVFTCSAPVNSAVCELNVLSL